MGITDEVKRIWLRIEAAVTGATPAGSATIGNVGLNAGTNTIGKLGSNSGVDIGDVDVTSVPADPFGVIADSIVAAGATGSHSAKLRRITQGLEDLKTLIVLGASSNAIGKLAANSGVDIGDVDVKSIAAGENHLGSMGGNSDKITNTITTTNASAYTAEDNIGGINTIANVLRVSGGTEILMDILIWDKDDQKAALQIDYWDASPSGTYTNDAGQVIVGDSAKWLGTVEVVAGDYKTTGAVAKAVLTNLGVVLKGNGSRNIFFTIKTTDTPTYTSTSGLIVKHGVLQD